MQAYPVPIYQYSTVCVPGCAEPATLSGEPGKCTLGLPVVPLSAPALLDGAPIELVPPHRFLARGDRDDRVMHCLARQVVGLSLVQFAPPAIVQGVGSGLRAL